MADFWKEDWDRARQRIIDWWDLKGPALCVSAPKDAPWAPIPRPPLPDDLKARWTDPEFRFAGAEWTLAHTYCGGVKVPYFDTQIGPGSLGLFMGSRPGFAPDTVWYEPCIDDPDSHPPLRFDPSGEMWKAHLALVEIGVARADGRFLVGLPDLIENLDTLAQLRDPQTLMEDLIERPEWVERSLWEINDAYFEAFDLIYDLIKDEHGGNAFCHFQIYGPGRTAKVQCDALAMISPTMFRDLVQPPLDAQCAWLDYSMFHLDGTQAMVHLDHLLQTEHLDAIEWTPQAGIESGGHPRWYDLYRRIKDGGKAVQAIGVLPHEVGPLLEAVGPEGVYVMVDAPTEAEARELERLVYG